MNEKPYQDPRMMPLTLLLWLQFDLAKISGEIFHRKNAQEILAMLDRMEAQKNELK